VPDINFGM